MNSKRLIELELKLQQIDAERAKVVEELLVLQRTIVNEAIPIVGGRAGNGTPNSSDEKITLFLSLFRCRRTVYPKLWENLKQNKKGYSPACNNEWVRGLCGRGGRVPSPCWRSHEISVRRIY